MGMAENYTGAAIKLGSRLEIRRTGTPTRVAHANI